MEYLDWKTLHLACCCYLTGVIWVIQLTHYPALLNLAAVVVIWFVTFALSVPSHSKLSRGRDLNEINKLVRDNWIRTILWTVRSAVLLGTL